MSNSGRFDDWPMPRKDDDLAVLIEQPEPATAEPLHSRWTNWASQRHVRDLAVTPGIGTLWLATGGGILRWYPRSRRFTRFASEHGLPGNPVSAVAVDGTGRVWAAPDLGGLYSLDGDAWQRCTVDKLGGMPVGCLVADPAGHLWAGTRAGVCALGGHGQVRLHIPFAATEQPRAMAVTGADQVWVCNARGLFRLHRDGTFDQHGKQPTLLALAAQGRNLWIGKVDGLVRFDLETEKPFQDARWPRGQVTALLPITDGALVACDGQLGVATLSDWRPILSSPSARHVAGMDITEDPDRMEARDLWLATGDGLFRVGLRAWDIAPLATDTIPDAIHAHGSEQLPVALSNMIQSLTLQSRPGHSRLWMGTPRGLFCLNPEDPDDADAWQFYGGEGIGDVQALTCSPDGGELWITGWEGQIRRVRASGAAETLTRLSSPILALCEGVGSTRWAVGLYGLYHRGDESTWTLALPADRLPLGCALRCAAQSGESRVWLGTSTGLHLYDPVTDRLDPVERSFHRAVTALAYDANGRVLWTGTEAGLFRLAADGDGWKTEDQFTARHYGLAADRITALALSQAQIGDTYLWIGTACGLTRYRVDS